MNVDWLGGGPPPASWEREKGSGAGRRRLRQPQVFGEAGNLCFLLAGFRSGTRVGIFVHFLKENFLKGTGGALSWRVL